MAPLPCAICGKPLGPPPEGVRNNGKRKYHEGFCAEEANRRTTKAYHDANRQPKRYVGPTGSVAYTLANFVRFCATLKVESGKPLKLDTFQKRILRKHFKGTPETVVVIPKGNGKTTLLSALALFHLLNIPDAEVIIAAASRDQARILFKQAAQLVMRSKVPGIEVKGGYGVIRFEGDRAGIGPRIRVIASDATTADGVIPTLALIDELHRHRNEDLYGVMRDGLGKRQGQMVTISTAGFSLDSPLGRLLEMAHGLPTFVRNGCYNYAETESLVWHEWALADDDDVNDLGLVAKANPASFVTVKDLEARLHSGSVTRMQWARFTCGLWRVSDDQPIRAEEWDRLAVDIGQVEEGESVVVVPSVGHNAAIAIAAARPDDRVAVRVEVIQPEEGVSIAVQTEQRILDLCQRYDVLAVHHPLAGFSRSADLLADQGVPMVEAPHSPIRLAAASGTFDRLLRSGGLMHDGDPTFRTHALAATRKSTESGERYEMTDRARGLIAAVFAVHALDDVDPPPFIGLPDEALA